MQISAALGKIIAEDFPCISYSEQELSDARAEFSDEDIKEMRDMGLMGDDFELFYVIRRFCTELSLGDIAEGDYILELFRNAKKLDASEFESNPYMRLAFEDKKKGDILLTHASYEKGEIFQYDMPDFDGRLVTPKLGFFTKKVSFPALYENRIPWVSVCPSEINSMREQIQKAFGKVLVLGLGLGYYPYAISLSEKVESITVVEISNEIADVFEETLLPLFEKKEKINVVRADAFEFMKAVEDGSYDFCFADIWEGAVDGAAAYEKLLPHEKRMPHTEFTYWIKPQIKAYLADKNGEA